MKNDIGTIKNDMKNKIGESITVCVRSSRGKKNIFSGKLSKVYPHVFIMSCDDESQDVCLSYTNVLTNRASVVIK